MFDSWTAIDWFILVIDIVAIAIVATFLKRKIQHKLAEVEARQSFHRQQRKEKRTTDD